jgi:alpha-tubulin suppressor-like RCC1 family protein
MTCGARPDASGHCFGSAEIQPQLTTSAITAKRFVAGPYGGGGQGNHVCMLDAADQLHCEGWSPTPEEPGGAWRSISMATNFDNWLMVDSHACGIDLDGRLWCWGRNSDGQLGDGTKISSDEPVPTGGSATWRVAEVHGDGGCAIRDDDASLWCWGLPPGHPDAATMLVPTPVRPGEAWTALATGPGHVCALRADASLWCWGDNGAGQLGDGTTTARELPARLGTDTWASVACGWRHTCGVRSDGTMWCWGDNQAGQLGDGTAFRTTPVLVHGS